MFESVSTCCLCLTATLCRAAIRVDLSAHERTTAVWDTLQRPRRLGGFGLSSAVLASPLAFLASVAASAAQPGEHPLSCDTLPASSLLHSWLEAALTSPVVDSLQRTSSVSVHPDANTFTSHYHSQPRLAAGLQSKLTTAATNSLYNARVSVVRASGSLRELARLHGGRAAYACRWKMTQPTESAYQLSDEHYRFAARRDVGLPPTKDTVLPHKCSACGVGMAADGRHGQRCVHNSAYTKLRHDSIEQLLHSTIIGGIGRAYRQQHNLPAAGRTIPDLIIYLDNKMFLCDVTVTDTLVDSNLAAASRRPGQLAREAANKKEDKYKHVAEQMGAVHLPFAVESMGGLSESAQQLIREVHHSVGSHCTWRDANAVGRHLVDAIAMAVQRCTGMALQASADREMRVAMGVGAA